MSYLCITIKKTRTTMAISYLKSEYGFKNGFKGIISEDYFLEERSFDCECGESSGYVVLDNEMNEVCRIIVCESCYANSAYHDRL